MIGQLLQLRLFLSRVSMDKELVENVVTGLRQRLRIFDDHPREKAHALVLQARDPPFTSSSPELGNFQQSQLRGVLRTKTIRFVEPVVEDTEDLLIDIFEPHALRSTLFEFVVCESGFKVW